MQWLFVIPCLVAVVWSSPTRRETVALWEACNYPDIGIIGPLQCAPGSECICKDDTYAQCREPIDGVWSDNPSWQCQKPGDVPTTAPNSGSGELSNPIGYMALGNSAGTSTGESHLAVSSSFDTAISRETAPSLRASKASKPKVGSMDTGSDMASTTYANASASIGGCSGMGVPSGWDGIASTSYYGYMGSSCMCGEGNFGQASWQANTGESLGIGQGIYSGAVNQKLFGGTLNSAGQPGCGSTCGICYELMTTGVNAYNDGTAGGSTIQMMVVDACYNTQGAPNWCSSNTDSGSDDFGCDVHFDIDTDPTQGDVPAVGQDGVTWTNGGQIVLYRRTACPPEMTDAFRQDCSSHC